MRVVKGGSAAKQKGLSTEDPELAARFNKVLEDVVEAMEEARVRYAFIGGIASSGLGRPRTTRDIDLFVTPEGAEVSLRALARHGFRTEKTDPVWLYKAFKEDILVDVIFKSKGDIYLDSEMYERMTIAEFHGKRLRLVAPEDLLIIKAVAHSEWTPSHWHDAIALLSHARLDWEYLIRRARRAPRRILSLLLYAQSNDIGVPNFVIHRLYQDVFGNAATRPPQAERSAVTPAPPAPLPREEEKLSRVWSDAFHREYGLGHLRERFAEDSRTNELDVQFELEDDRVILRGEVSSPERRMAAQEVAQEFLPDKNIDNQIRVQTVHEPDEMEKVS